jgi:hypothetical protein
MQRDAASSADDAAQQVARRPVKQDRGGRHPGHQGNLDRNPSISSTPRCRSISAPSTFGEAQKIDAAVRDAPRFNYGNFL